MIDLELDAEYYAYINMPEARAAYRLALTWAPGFYKLKLGPQGTVIQRVVRFFSKHSDRTHPFAFIVNRGDLRWYCRGPSRWHPAMTLENLRQFFPDIFEKYNSKGKSPELVIVVRTAEDMEKVIRHVLIAYLEPQLAHAANVLMLRQLPVPKTLSGELREQP